MPATPEQQRAAIRTRVWMGGKWIFRDPVPIQLSVRRFEARSRTSNLGMRVDRAMTLAGMPNVRTRHEFTLPWPNIHEPDQLDHLDILAGIGQPFSLGLWKQVYDVFDGDAVAQQFYLQRRQLLPVVTPPVAHQDYPTRVLLFDKPYTDPTAVATSLSVIHKTSATIASGNPAANEAWVEDDGHGLGNITVSTLRVGTAPPDFHDCLVAVYLPLYSVLIDQENPRSYAAALVEPRGFKLVEI